MCLPLFINNCRSWMEGAIGKLCLTRPSNSLQIKIRVASAAKDLVIRPTSKYTRSYTLDSLVSIVSCAKKASIIRAIIKVTWECTKASNITVNIAQNRSWKNRGTNIIYRCILENTGFGVKIVWKASTKKEILMNTWIPTHLRHISFWVKSFSCCYMCKTFWYIES